MKTVYEILVDTVQAKPRSTALCGAPLRKVQITYTMCYLGLSEWSNTQQEHHLIWPLGWVDRHACLPMLPAFH